MDTDTKLRLYALHVSGKADPPVAHSPAPEDQPVKLWEGLAPEHMGPPHLSHSHELPYGRVLDVIDHPAEGIVRRTLWRIP
jgi:hypothetical protein